MTRSQNMSRVKNKNTKPEVYFRKLLWREGLRYRIHYKKLPGTPDIFISKYKTAIFVNGCFWHMHEGCKLTSIPKTNTEFWSNKLTGNVDRDKKNYQKLKEAGIKVIVVWGCEISKMQKDSLYMREYIQELRNFILCTD